VNLGGRHHLARIPLTGTWYRAVRPQFLHSALGYDHTAGIPGRFTAGIRGARPTASALYLAESPDLALLEVDALLGRPRTGREVIPNPNSGVWAVVPVRVTLGRVVDLCDPFQLQLLDTSVQELTGDWIGYRERPHPGPRPPLAPTQQLGMALHATPRVEGFLTYAARHSVRRNLIVFPTKLRSGSSITVTDPATGAVRLSLP
jgi:hypothetical protein